jgi:HPt (histidine-containing phosphotransfer) domain-containing protein
LSAASHRRTASHLPGFGPDQVKLRAKKKIWEAGMAQAAVRIVESSPEAMLESAVLDRAHLARMTFGDRSLEREVLRLFDRQAELLIDRMRASQPAAVATLAHTLKGSAAGIGAGRVAHAAEAVELIAAGSPGECSHAIDQLAQTIDEARKEIAALIRAQ